MFPSSKDQGVAKNIYLLNYLTSFLQTRRQDSSSRKQRNVMAPSSHGSNNSSIICSHEPDQESDNYASWDEDIAIDNQLLAYRSI